MNRRNFLKNTATVSALSTISFSAIAMPLSLIKNDEVDFIADFELNEITVDELQAKMQNGKISSKTLTEMYLRRIAQIDKNGPKLNAIIELNPDALAIAVKMDEERKRGNNRGPLHGIPILIKDNINTGDKMQTTAGSLALEGNVASADAFIVTKLREAGAVLLGKTNLSEWANFRSNRSCSGWSSRGGQTKNPYILDRSPSGSSSGSGAAVSANLCAIAIGTETNGSIIAPASYCGVVGFKPTVGLWSRSGIIPISTTQDTAGTMCRTVTDTAILLGALTGVDRDDAITKTSEGKTYSDYTQFLKTDALKGKRLGIEKSFLNGHEGVVALYKSAIEKLKELGAEIIEIELLKDMEAIGRASVLQPEFKAGVNAYLAKANAKVKTLTDVIAFNKENEAIAMPYFKQEILEASNKETDLSSPTYKANLAKINSAKNIISNLMEKNKLDAVVGTSYGIPSLIDLFNGDYGDDFYFASPAAMAGYPHITVPMGRLFELPVGLSIFAGAYQEPVVLAFGYAFEQATKHRKAPKFLKNSNFSSGV
ncbi:amidase [Pedobacter changchengzhani]|uniref:Amidase n=1 Tax=Pedobacter changchengzhani TaxID=2529274 RepID=A0A4R5MMF3_9SPHI|nr:amidase [Pedobacter changchengzhani]TDG36911.1 amidase [Pedobacter changchengzhani]